MYLEKKKLIKIFLKSPCIEIHYDEEESPSEETVGAQYKEDKDDEQTKLFNENNEDNENLNENQNQNPNEKQHKNQNKEEKEEEEDHENVVFIRKTPVHPRDRLRRKTTKRLKYF